MKTLLHRSWGKIEEIKPYCPICTQTYIKTETERPWESFTYSDNPIYLVKKEGKFGKFYGCPNYPNCKYSLGIKRREVFIDFEDELRPY